MSADTKEPGESLSVEIWKLVEGPEVELPRYMTPGAAGCDLQAALPTEISLAAGARCLVPTGLGVAIPAGFEGQVRPRSGLAIREGLTVLNAPGTIDADYRGEIKVALVNLGQDVVKIAPGDRIAQLVVAPVVRAIWVERPASAAGEQLSTERGAGGFGHTGLSGRGDGEPEDGASD